MRAFAQSITAESTSDVLDHSPPLRRAQKLSCARLRQPDAASRNARVRFDPFRPRSTLLGRHGHGEWRRPAGSHAHGSVDDPLPIRDLQHRVGWHAAPLGLQRELVPHPAGFWLDDVHRPQASAAGLLASVGWTAAEYD